ncbi:MAG: tetratricopeptide repeat protein, partial [Desulfovibrionaceae bacterium]
AADASQLLEAAENTLRPEAVAQAAQVVQPLADQDLAVGLRLADAWLGVNRPAAAWPLLQAYARNAEDDPELLRKTITAAAMTRNPAALREALALAQRHGAITPEMLLDVAELLVEAGDLDGAAAMYARYLARVPGDRKAALRLAEVQSWRGAPGLAFDVLAALLRSRPDDLALTRTAAAYAEEAGRDADAFRLYAMLFRADPGDTAVREAYLRLAEWTGNVLDAAKLLAEDSDRDPGSLSKARKAADAFLAVDQPRLALPYLERAFGLDPGDAALRRSLAGTYGALGDVDRQAATLEPLARSGLLTEDESVLVAGRFLTRKRPQDALDTLQRFEDRHPLPWDAGTMLVQTYSLLHRLEMTDALMRRLKDDYADLPGRLNAIGDMAVMYKQLDFAFSCYAAALKADPRNSAALKGQAQIYAWNNDADRAIQKFEAYLVRRPGDMEARYQLGELYYANDREGEAFGQYKKTLKLIREARLARQHPSAGEGSTP